MYTYNTYHIITFSSLPTSEGRNLMILTKWQCYCCIILTTLQFFVVVLYWQNDNAFVYDIDYIRMRLLNTIDNITMLYNIDYIRILILYDADNLIMLLLYYTDKMTMLLLYNTDNITMLKYNIDYISKLYFFLRVMMLYICMIMFNVDDIYVVYIIEYINKLHF